MSRKYPQDLPDLSVRLVWEPKNVMREIGPRFGLFHPERGLALRRHVGECVPKTLMLVVHQEFQVPNRRRFGNGRTKLLDCAEHVKSCTWLPRQSDFLVHREPILLQFGEVPDLLGRAILGERYFGVFLYQLFGCSECAPFLDGLWPQTTSCQWGIILLYTTALSTWELCWMHLA